MELDLCDKLVLACQQLAALNIHQGSRCSLSCRIATSASDSSSSSSGSSCDAFLITPEGYTALDSIPAQDIVRVDYQAETYQLQESGTNDQAKVGGSKLPVVQKKLPSSEWMLHSALYRSRPEAAAVVHLQPTACSALSSHRKGIPAIHYMVAAVAAAKEIPCAEYAPWGSPELAENMLKAMGDCRVVLLANHGLVCHGPSLDKVIWIANEAECLARQYLSALSTKLDPTILSSEEMDVMLAKFKSYGKQAGELQNLTEFEKRHAISAPPRKDVVREAGDDLEYRAERQQVIDICLRMNRMGINQGTSGNASCRVPKGFLITASGVAYEKMLPEQVVLMSLEGSYDGPYKPSSEWRMHYDIYRTMQEAEAVVHAHPTYCTALSALRWHIPGFHHMVAVAGGKCIPCSDYATFGTQELSDCMLESLQAGCQSVLLANHGMVCHGSSLESALRLANETENLAKKYISALSLGSEPVTLCDDDLVNNAQKMNSYGKQPSDNPRQQIRAPKFAGTFGCACCAGS